MSIKNLKDETHKLYRSLGSMWCNAVKDNVVFNNYGWIHLSFSRGGHRRKAGDLKLRQHLFFHVPEVIKKAKVVIKITEGMIISRKGISRKARYYEIAHLCGGKQHVHVTVVLRRIESGKLHYYSVRRTGNKTKKALIKTGLL